MKNVKVFRLPNGKEPFEKWVQALSQQTRAVIDAYIDRVALGGGKNIILLLLGGDKKTQNRDIKKAKEYWRIYAQK